MCCVLHTRMDVPTLGCGDGRWRVQKATCGLALGGQCSQTHKVTVLARKVANG